MKRLLIIVAAVVTMLALLGCDERLYDYQAWKDSQKQSTQQQIEQPKQQPEQSMPQQDNEQSSDDPYLVNIASAEIVTDSRNRTLLVVAIEYTNNSNTEVSFLQAVPTVAALNGVSLGSATFSDLYVGDDGSTPDYMLKVFPGTSTVVHVPFEVSGAGNVIVKCDLGFVDGKYPELNKTVDQQEFTIER